jgi:CDP-diacylglycerol--glycerol-3-phosphate 3-phosphatidyltransferase
MHRRDKSISQEQRRKEVHHQGIQPRDFLLAPNLLTLSRIFFIIPAVIIIAISHGDERDIIAAGLLALGFFTDMLDGIVARAFKQISQLGKILDPVVDKLVVLSTATALAFTDRDPNFPIWLLGGIFVRDIVILLLARRALQEDHYLFVSSWTGKVTTFAIATTLLVFLLDQYVPDDVVVVFPWVVFGLLILSSIDYLEKYWSVRHKRYIEKNKGQA